MPKHIHEPPDNAPSCLTVMIMMLPRNGYLLHDVTAYPIKVPIQPFCTRKCHCKPDLQGVLYLSLGFTHKLFHGNWCFCMMVCLWLYKECSQCFNFSTMSPLSRPWNWCLHAPTPSVSPSLQNPVGAVHRWLNLVRVHDICIVLP